MDDLETILDRHREIWTARLYWCALLALCVGIPVGYLIRVWFG